MNDRELLELSAKAVHVKLHWQGEVAYYAVTEGYFAEWNPLSKYSQADHLAYLLKVRGANYRAIVRAAAEIGRKMQC